MVKHNSWQDNKSPKSIDFRWLSTSWPMSKPATVIVSPRRLFVTIWTSSAVPVNWENSAADCRSTGCKQLAGYQGDLFIQPFRHRMSANYWIDMISIVQSFELPDIQAVYLDLLLFPIRPKNAEPCPSPFSRRSWSSYAFDAGRGCPATRYHSSVR